MVHGECIIEGCKEKRFARGWCRHHWRLFEKQGVFTPTPRPPSWGTIEKHPLLHAWRHIFRRNAKENYPICDDWIKDPRLFFAEIGEKPGKDYKLHLKSQSIGYMPGNLEWIETKIKTTKTDEQKFDSAAYQREYRKKNPRNCKNSELKRTFGISIHDYDEMFERQNGKCAICGSDKGGMGRSLAVDHCHATGKVRGLLCQQCNKGLGHFRDSTVLLESAIKYLRL